MTPLQALCSDARAVSQVIPSHFASSSFYVWPRFVLSTRLLPSSGSQSSLTISPPTSFVQAHPFAAARVVTCFSSLMPGSGLLSCVFEGVMTCFSSSLNFKGSSKLRYKSTYFSHSCLTSSTVAPLFSASSLKFSYSPDAPAAERILTTLCKPQ